MMPDNITKEYLDPLVKSKILFKKKKFGEESFLNNEVVAFMDEKILPSTIFNLQPIPKILRKDYLFFLWFRQIDVFKLFDIKDHKQILEYYKEYVYFMDKNRSKLEFGIFKEISAGIKLKNEYLYTMLKDNQTESFVNYDEKKQLEGKKFSKYFL